LFFVFFQISKCPPNVQGKSLDEEGEEVENTIGELTSVYLDMQNELKIDKRELIVLNGQIAKATRNEKEAMRSVEHSLDKEAVNLNPLMMACYYVRQREQLQKKREELKVKIDEKEKEAKEKFVCLKEWSQRWKLIFERYMAEPAGKKERVNGKVVETVLQKQASRGSGIGGKGLAVGKEKAGKDSVACSKVGEESFKGSSVGPEKKDDVVKSGFGGKATGVGKEQGSPGNMAKVQVGQGGMVKGPKVVTKENKVNVKAGHCDLDERKTTGVKGDGPNGKFGESSASGEGTKKFQFKVPLSTGNIAKSRKQVEVQKQEKDVEKVMGMKKDQSLVVVGIEDEFWAEDDSVLLDAMDEFEKQESVERNSSYQETTESEKIEQVVVDKSFGAFNNGSRCLGDEMSWDLSDDELLKLADC